MKKILMIAPASIPINGAEHIVNAKLLEAFSLDGNFEIDLIAKKHKWEHYPSNSKLNLNLKSLNIIEVDNKFTLITLWQHFLTLLYFGIVFKGAHWAAKALPIVKKLVANNQYDYVLTKDTPSLLLGYYLKKKYGLKWVATWNDPYPVSKYPHPYGLGLNGKETFIDKLQINIMKKWVDIHIYPSKRLCDYMNSYLQISSDKIRIIPHVVLPSEKQEIKITSDVLRFIHSGNLKYPRDPSLFIKGVLDFVTRYPNKKIEISILGTYDKELGGIIKENKLEDIFKFIKPVPYDESLTLLKNYHVALIIEAQCEEGIFLPTKVSDFIQCRKHILAISPINGVLHDLYMEKCISYFASNCDYKCISDEINRIYEDFINDKMDQFPDIKSDFNYTNIVQQYKIV